MRILSSPIQQILQNAKSQNPVYKVERKGINDLDWEDITPIVSDLSLSLNGEGEPNSAVLDIVSVKGEYDLLNVKSINSHYFTKGTEIRIYFGYQNATEKMFTGFVQENYDHSYSKKSVGKVSIKVGDRGTGTGQIDFQEEITTRLYQTKTDAEKILYPGNPDPADPTKPNYWTAKEIIEDLLQYKGGMDIADILVDNELNEIDVHSIQFVKEPLWDILMLCCETRRQIGYFDEDGKFRTMPMQFSLTNYNEGTDISGTFTKQIQHYVKDDILCSQMVVIGGVKFPGRRGESHIVIDVDPFRGAFGRQANFESQTDGTGNPNYDSLYGTADIIESEKCFGEGFQGTVVPVVYNGDVPRGDYFEEGYSGPANPNDPAHWKGIFQGPFQFTINGIPKEPFQLIKTGIGDTQGLTGYFPTYNADGGTSVSVDWSTRNLDSDHNIFPIEAMELVTCVHYGVLPSREEWEKANWNEPLRYPYPTLYTSDNVLYDGPTEEEFFIYCLSFCDFYGLWFAYGRRVPYSKHWLQICQYFYTVFHWGQTYSADWTDLPEEHYKGTAIDNELMQFYGNSRFDEMENPLLFSDSSCQYLGALTLDRYRKFHIQVRFERPIHLELQFGDVIEIYNPEIACTEKICLSRLDYKMNKGSSCLIEMRGGVINVEGTEIKAWR